MSSSYLTIIKTWFGLHVHDTETICNILIAHGCFITYNKGYGHISTPVDTDGYYFDNMDCTWTILSSVGGGSISLYIMEMDIRSNYMFPCEQDYIEVKAYSLLTFLLI